MNRSALGHIALRVAVYLTVFVIPIILYFLTRFITWNSSNCTHTLLEVSATIFALVVGIMALIKYYTRRKIMYLFIGFGYLGTGLIQSFHIVLTSSFLYRLFPGSSLSNNPVFFLSIMVFLSWLAWKKDIKTGENKGVNIAFGTLLFVGLVFFFLLLPSGFYYTNPLFRRLGELGSMVFFSLAFIGYLTKGYWKTKYFEHWLVMSLIVSIFVQGLFVPFSLEPFDIFSTVALVLRNISYVFSLIGLFISTYIAYEEVEGDTKRLAAKNLALQKAKRETQEKSYQLAAERDKAAAIISSMGEGLLVIDANHRISLINQVAEKLLEVTAKEAVGKKWSDIVKAYEGDKEISLEKRSFTTVLQNQKPIITEMEKDHYYKTKSGRKFPIESITTSLATGGVLSAIKVFRDITHEKEEKLIIEQEVKKRTREVQEEQARLAASLTNLPVGFILTDLLGNILIINPVAKKIFELSNAKTLSQLEAAFRGMLDIRKSYEECRQNKRAVEFKEVAFGKKSLHLFISPIIMSNRDEYIGSAMLVEDITEAKILERSKDEFFSIASHELRTPLTAIRGNATLLSQYYANKITDKDIQEMINDIHGASERLIEIVNDFLELSRLEQGRIVFKKEAFEIIPLVKNVVEELQKVDANRHLFFKVEVSEPLPKVLADIERVRQILINIVGNSVKYTEKGGITITCKPQKRFIEVLISDTGRGIPLVNQSLLFHKFQQAGESLFTRDTTKGTGLGLYISKLLVENMGGKIWLAHSEPDRGSTFAFTLPIGNN